MLKKLEKWGMGKQEFTKLDARTFYKAIVMETIQVTMETN